MTVVTSSNVNTPFVCRTVVVEGKKQPRFIYSLPDVHLFVDQELGATGKSNLRCIQCVICQCHCGKSSFADVLKGSVLQFTVQSFTYTDNLQYIPAGAGSRGSRVKGHKPSLQKKSRCPCLVPPPTAW